MGYTLQTKIPIHSIEKFETALEHVAQAIDINFIQDDDYTSTDINLKIFLSGKLAIKQALIIFQDTASKLGIEIGDIQEEIIQNKDWVAESQSSFSPFYVGGFYIHPSYVKCPNNLIRTIKINAGPAFGSGTHPTTQTCILSLEYLQNTGFTPNQILDMGTGSGILAIASAKLWRAHIFAVDNDPVALKTAKDNSKMNNCSRRITLLHADDFNKYELKNIGNFNLIVINILANEVLRMSKSILNILDDQGYVVLSGFLDNQTKLILKTYSNLEMTLIQKFTVNNWTTVILKLNRGIADAKDGYN
tara:strand:+ start:4495 stop:5406 length:912 start_codon:yes stop_codon:yes gene_type:complete